MEKAIKQIIKQIKLIDLIIEIIDSRIPFSSSNPLINNLFGFKQKLIILNKKDLVDPIIIKEWLEYYKKRKISVLALNSKNNNNKKLIIKKIFNILNEKIINNYNKGIKISKIKIIVLGIPNVGKSTFINSLIKRKSTKVNKKPGMTKGQQWLKLNNKIDIIDTPGILWPKINNQNTALNLAFVYSIKESLLSKEDICLYAIKWMYKNYFYLLKKHYNIKKNNNFDITNNKDIFKLLLIMQQNRFNKINKNNINNIINDFLYNLWNNKFGLISFEFPPKK